eukprot:scaffold65712_cov53-Phaeocystis_antarctica.AAC.4
MGRGRRAAGDLSSAHNVHAAPRCAAPPQVLREEKGEVEREMASARTAIIRASVDAARLRASSSAAAAPRTPTDGGGDGAHGGGDGGDGDGGGDGGGGDGGGDGGGGDGGVTAAELRELEAERLAAEAAVKADFAARRAAEGATVDGDGDGDGGDSDGSDGDGDGDGGDGDGDGDDGDGGALQHLLRPSVVREASELVPAGALRRSSIEYEWMGASGWLLPDGTSTPDLGSPPSLRSERAGAGA